MANKNTKRARRAGLTAMPVEQKRSRDGRNVHGPQHCRSFPQRIMTGDGVYVGTSKRRRNTKWYQSFTGRATRKEFV